jgi:hypothetical protein
MSSEVVVMFLLFERTQDSKTNLRLALSNSPTLPKPRVGSFWKDLMRPWWL